MSTVERPGLSVVLRQRCRLFYDEQSHNDTPCIIQIVNDHSLRSFSCKVDTLYSIETVYSGISLNCPKFPQLLVPQS